MSTESITTVLRNPAKEYYVQFALNHLAKQPTQAVGHKIFTDVSTVLMELTLRCSSPICSYCYRRKFTKNDVGVSTKEHHVSKEELLKRLVWIRRNTSATTVTGVGGESLLSPHFIYWVKQALLMGFEVEVITCGDAGKSRVGQRNLEALKKMWVAGLVNIQLSFHKGPKEKAYRSLFEFVHENLSQRLENMKYLMEHLPAKSSLSKRIKLDMKEGMGLFSSVTIGPEFIGKRKQLTELLYRLWKDTYGQDPKKRVFTDDDGRKGSLYNSMKLNAKMIEQALKNGTRAGDVAEWEGIMGDTDSDEGARTLKVRFWSARSITSPGPLPDSNVQRRRIDWNFDDKAELGTCPAMECQINDTSKTIVSKKNSLVLRTDGELVFSTPPCIPVPAGLGNISMSTNELFMSARTYIKFVKKTMVLASIARAERQKNDKLKCRPNASDCPGCPLAVACNACLSYTRHPTR